MPSASYRIYAVRYAHRTCTSSEAFYGDHDGSPMGMDYFVWALANGTHAVVVDLGFTEAVGSRRGRQFLRCPSRGLAEIGIDCAQVEHVVLSHFHYDHVGNYALFPRATVMSSCAGPSPPQPLMVASIGAMTSSSRRPGTMASS